MRGGNDKHRLLDLLGPSSLVDMQQVPLGHPLLGGGEHEVWTVEWTEIAGQPEELQLPRDLAVNTSRPNELWVVNQLNESVVILFDFGTPAQHHERYWSLGSAHFMAQPSGIAFGAAGSMATIHETDKQTQGPGGTPADFMGPTLQSTDLHTFDAGHGSHLDMLHNTPNGMGIAWEKNNVYWVFDGYHAALVRYDFDTDHGKGGADHSSGSIARYVEGHVKREPGVPSHLSVDPSTGLVYVADTGNNRVAVLDPDTGSPGSPTFPNYDGTAQYRVNQAVIATVVEGAQAELIRPSGLTIHDGLMYVSDNANGRITAFTLEGERVDWLNTGLLDGALMGLDFDAEGNLYLVDAVMWRVYKVAPLAKTAE